MSRQRQENKADQTRTAPDERRRQDRSAKTQPLKAKPGLRRRWVYGSVAVVVAAVFATVVFSPWFRAVPPEDSGVELPSPAQTTAEPPSETLPVEQAMAPPAEGEVPDPVTSGLGGPARDMLQKARAAVLANPESPESWGRFGAMCDVHKLYDCAETCFRRARALKPDGSLFAYFLACSLQVSGHDDEEAIALFETAERAQSDYAPIPWRLGIMLEEQGRLEEARDAYLRSIQIDPQLAIGHRSIGQVLLALGEAGDALPYLEEAAELSPYDSAVFVALAQAYQSLGQPERAAEAAETARLGLPVADVVDPLRNKARMGAIAGEGFFARGKTLTDLGRYRQALSDLRMCEAADPADPVLQVFLATCYRSTSQLGLAKLHATRALQLQENSFIAHVELAMVFLKQRQLERGMQHYRRAQEIRPANSHIDIWIAPVLVQEGYLRQGIVAFERAADLGSINADSHWMWGLALGDSGDLDGAIEHFESSVRLDSTHTGALFSLGMAFEQSSRREEAIEAYNRALEIDPSHHAAERLANLQSELP